MALVLGFKSSERCNTFNFVKFLGEALFYIFGISRGKVKNLKILRGWGWEERGSENDLNPPGCFFLE